MADLLIFLGSSVTIILVLISPYLISVVVHEFGHAIPALIFTDGKVQVFIGSMGDSNTPHFNFGKRLTVHFTLNPLRWLIGMVKHPAVKAKSVVKDLLIIITGPLAPFALSAVMLYACYHYDLQGVLKYFSIFFLLWAVIQLSSLIPSSKPVKLHDGSFTFCDGYQALRLIKLRRHLSDISSAYNHYQQDNFDKAAEIFKTLPAFFVDKTNAEMVLYSYWVTQNVAETRAFYLKYNNLLTNFASNTDLMLFLGVAESKLNNHSSAIAYYTKSLEFDSNNYFAHCNLGYTYNLLGRYNQAITEFTAALAIESEYAYAVSNMAISYLKLGNLDEARKRLDHALLVGSDDTYTFKNWGIYYLETNEPEEALKNFLKAKQLEPDTHLLEHYIKMTEERLSPVK